MSRVSLSTTYNLLNSEFDKQVDNPVSGLLHWNSPVGVYRTVGSLLNVALFIAGLIAVGMVVYAGFRYVTSGGDPEKIKSATGTITYAIVGVVILYAAKLVLLFFFSELN